MISFMCSPTVLPGPLFPRTIPMTCISVFSTTPPLVPLSASASKKIRDVPSDLFEK